MTPLFITRRARWFFIVLAIAASGPWSTVQAVLGQTLPRGNPLREEQPDAARHGPQDPSGDLAQRATRLADRFDRLEMLAGRLAELSRATHPQRAKLLRELISQSHDRDIAGRYQRIVDALQSHALSSAHGRQLELQDQLRKLLELLLREDRDRQIESQRKRLRKYLSDVKRLVRLQRGLKARTEGGDQARPLAAQQQRIVEDAKQLQQDIADQEGRAESPKLSPEQAPHGEPADVDQDKGDQDKGDQEKGDQDDGRPAQETPRKAKSQDEPGPQGSSQKQPFPGGQPGGQSPAQKNAPAPGETPQGSQPAGGQGGTDGQAPPPGENPSPPSPISRAQQNLEKARQKMQAAEQKLEKAQRDGAVQQQEQALRALEQAQAELERILRQLREEELERTLVMLEARFRKMLELQIEVHEQTQRLDSRQAAAVATGTEAHEVEIASGRLSRKERQIVQEADRAMILLREDGSSVAFPETLDQAREDMQSVADRLGEVRLGTLTQGLEEDIISALEESLAALQKALKEVRDNQQGKPQSGGGPPEQALVDQLAELRMIRSLQQRVNRRTERYGKLVGGEEASAEEIVAALNQLALREQRIYEATHDLHTKENQ